MNTPDIFASARQRFALPKAPPCPPGELELWLSPGWLTDSLVCRFDCQGSEEMTRDDPGCPATMDLQSAWIGSVDISGALGDEQREALEELAVEELKQQRENAEIDAADARYERSR